jgi:hypothetical protein
MSFTISEGPRLPPFPRPRAGGGHRAPVPPLTWASEAETAPCAHLPVGQAGDRAGAGCVMATMVPIGLGDRLVVAQAADPVFHRNPLAGKRGVGDDIVVGSRGQPRFAPRRGHRHARGRHLPHPDVGQIAGRALAVPGCPHACGLATGTGNGSKWLALAVTLPRGLARVTAHNRVT